MNQFCYMEYFDYLAIATLWSVSLTYLSIAPTYWVRFMFLPLVIMLHLIQYFWGFTCSDSATSYQKAATGLGYNRRQIQAMIYGVSTWWMMKLMKAIRCTHTLLGHLDSVSRVFQYNTLTSVNISPYKRRYVNQLTPI